MNYFSKNRIILWIVSSMLVISLTALGTMIYRTYLLPAKISQSKECPSSRQFLTTELDLNADQLSKIENINTACLGASRCIMQDLRVRRLELLEELSRDQSDTAELKRMASEIGMIQADLLNSTIAQYLAIKKICSPGQKEKLSNMYFDLFGCQKGGMGKGKQYRHRHGQEN